MNLTDHDVAECAYSRSRIVWSRLAAMCVPASRERVEHLRGRVESGLCSSVAPAHSAPTVRRGGFQIPDS